MGETFSMDLHGRTVLQVVPEMKSGGVERGAVEIAAALVQAGACALVASAGGRMVAELEGAGGVHAKLPLASKNPLTIYANIAALADLARDNGVDVIHARSRAPGWSALLAARRVGCAFVTTYHGAYNEDLPGKRLYNSVMAKGDRVIAISDFIARLIAERHGVAGERVRVIPRGADLARFTPARVAPERVAALRAAWGLDGETRAIVMLPGRLTRWKGQTVLIDAMATLPRGRALALIVGGEKGAGALTGGPYETELRARAAELGVADDLRLVGPIADMPAALMLADLVVSASTDPEAFGRVAVEAQAMGKPVLASAHGGSTETVAQAETGWLTPPGDAAALAAALAQALEAGPAAWVRLGAAGRARVEARFSVARMQAATLALYAELLA